MAKVSKRKKLARETIEIGKAYGIEEALGLLEKFASTKLKESIDVAVNLGINSRQADQNVRGATTLPHGNGKNVRVAVFADGEKADEARAAGADEVGLEDLAEKVKGGETNFDVVIAARNAMRVVGGLGRILGPRGLMPNPKSGTVTDEIDVAVKNAKSGQVQYRSDRGGIVHGSIGVIGQNRDHVKENVEALLIDLKKAKPPASKGQYLEKITISTTMGPGIVIDESSISI